MPESQGRFEGGATSLMTCPSISGLLGLAIEKVLFRKPVGLLGQDQGRGRPSFLRDGVLELNIEQKAAIGSWTTLRYCSFA